MQELYKIYHDGSHFVATAKQYALSKTRKPVKKTNLDVIFDNLYFQAIKKNLYKKDLFNFIKIEMLESYCLEDNEMLNKFIERKIKIKLNNFHKRVKRFKRKANLNKWNYFLTITFDPKKHTAQSFRQKLKKSLSNLHSRRGWKYMGVFELSPEEQRLHFHALAYIPNGEMPGEIVELKDYSTKEHKMQTSHSNTFFAQAFGRNDFTPITQTESTLNYILKYLHKTNERIFYSRGIPTEIFKNVNQEDIATKFEDFGLKFVLFDDVIESEDILSRDFVLKKDRPILNQQVCFA